jgi:hypothetical protein
MYKLQINFSSVFDLMCAMTASHTQLSEGSLRPVADTDRALMLRQFSGAASAIILDLSDLATPPTVIVRNDAGDKVATFTFTLPDKIAASVESALGSAVETMVAMRLLAMSYIRVDSAYAASLTAASRAHAATLIQMLSREDLPPSITPHY